MGDIWYIILIIVVIALFVAYYILVVKEKNPDKKLIYGVRERLENKKYQLSEFENSDPALFFDNAQLVLTSKHDKLSLSNTTIRNDSFFTNLGIYLNDNLQVERNGIALLMPFNSKFDNRYQNIKQACEEVGFICHRSDENYETGNLLKQIVELILKSQLIIALIDGKNPNVFYEIGIAHSLGKPVILIANMVNEYSIPFNISSERLLLYTNMSDLKEKLTKTLKTLKNVDE